jgi:hypothetical protein
MDENIDQLERRCPRLGGPVSFAYCQTSSEDHSACWKIFDCWWECFDVVGHLKKSLTEDRFERLVNAKPKPKIINLVELIAQAKNRIS